MATQTLTLIRRMEMEARSKGFDKLAGDLDKVAKSHEGVVVASEKTEKSTRSTEQALAREERALDKTKTAWEAFVKSVTTINRAREQGAVSEQRAGELINLADQRLRRMAGGAEEMAKSTGLARHELINLGRQLQDVGVSLFSGQSPLTVAVQQGAQGFDIFASSGAKMSAILAQLGGMALRLAPAAAAIGAVAAAIYAVNKASDEARESRIATTSGRGRFSDVLPGDVDRLARAGAGGGVSRGEAREGVLTGVGQGLSGQVITQMVKQAERLAATLGKDVPDATKILAGALREGAGGAKTLYETYGLLDAKTVEHIRVVQQEQGIEAARLETLRLLPKSLASAADATTIWGTAWANVKNNLSDVLDLVNKLPRMSPGDVGDRGVQASYEQQRREELRRGTPLETFRRGPSEGAMQAQIDAPHNKALSEAADRYEAITIAIQKLNQTYNDQVGVLNAFTIAEQATAAETQTYNQALRNNVEAETAAAQAGLARQMVLAQSDAATQKAIASQQIQIDMYSRLAQAAGMQGLSGARVNAELQMELQLRQQGLNVLTAENQQRIQNAGILARQAVALRDITQATEARASGRDQLELSRLETQLVGEDAIEREKRLAVMKGEIEARALERQGMTESAAATREVTSALAEEAAKRAELHEALQLEAGDRQAAAAAAQRQAAAYQEAAAAAQRSAQAEAAANQQRRATATQQGRDPNSMTMHGGTTRASDWPQAGAGGQGMSFSISDPLAEGQGLALYGAGNFTMQTVARNSPGSHNAGFGVIPVPTEAYLQQQAAQAKQKKEQERTSATQGLQGRMQLASTMLSKRLEELNETIGKSDELQQKLDADEDKRQQKMQQYLAAGPSPYEQNADLYYDPKKRLLFAEQIAGNTSDLLKQQLAAAKADEANAKAQIKAIEAQQEQLQTQSDLLAAGVDLTKEEIAGIIGLTLAVRNELPENLAIAYDRMAAAGLKEPGATSPGAAPASYTTDLLKQTAGSQYQAGDAANIFGGTGRVLGGYATGGDFTVPGSGSGDRPFRIGLTPGEHVSVTPPGKRAGGGTTVERMIVQLPPGSDPIVLMNKTSRAAMARGTRRMGRMM